MSQRRLKLVVERYPKKVYNYGKFVWNIPESDAIEIRVIRAKVQLGVWVLNMGWARISSIDVGIGKLLLVKFNQKLNNWIKRSFFFLEFLCLLNLRIYFCLKSAKPWLEFRIKFNWYSMRSFQRAMVEFNNLRIYFTFRGFNRVSMSKISSPPIQMESWSSCLGGGIFSVSEEIVYSFKFFFDLFSNNIYLTYVPQFG